jgi:phage-related protein
VIRPATKPVTFVGSSLNDLRDFPQGARRETGYQLDKVQNGEEPASWKPMSTVGSGAHEIRVRDDSGAFRLMYVAKFPEAVYVLHAFQKKTRATARKDLSLAQERYQEVLTMRKSK